MCRAQSFVHVIVFGIAISSAGPAFLRGDEKQNDKPDWVDSMAAVHARSNGQRGTFAHFGDSITISMAFWAPLQREPKGLSPAAARAHRRVKDYLSPDCWSNWKGPEFGNQGSMTIRWAHENVDGWLKRLNPEAALIMFGTNDLGQVPLDEYKQKTRDVVRRCLRNGTVVILSTIPPRSGRLKESQMYAEAAAAIAREEKVPLVDYFGEILRRRPDDWDGSLKKFRDAAGDDYQVLTLIARDGVHPSNPRPFAGNFSDEALNNCGFSLRSHQVLLAYSDVIERVLDPKAAPEDKPDEKPKVKSTREGKVRATNDRPRRFPHRIWAGCDFEGRTPDYAWFGPPETGNIPKYPGNVTALGIDNRARREDSAVMTGINPVPGPRMGKVNHVSLRYFLKGATEATFQYFSLTREDNNHIHVTGLTEGKWSDLTLNFTRDARRNDGSDEPFAEGERMDDFKVFVGKPGDGKTCELLLDDVVFFAEDPQQPAANEPFPNRVIFLAAFDTGPKEKYWPGDFEIVEKALPADSWWRVARAVSRKNGKGKWIRLQINPPRPVGEHTKLRFRCHLTGASALTAQIFDATDQDNRHVSLRDLKQGAWTMLDVDLTRDGRRNDGSNGPFAAGHLVDDLFFFVEPAGDTEVDLLIDEVVLYDVASP